MSMLSEQVKELRKMSIRQRNNAKVSEKVFFEIENALSEAADTIEALSAKLSVENMERSDRYYGGGWISVKKRLPEPAVDVLVLVECTNLSWKYRIGRYECGYWLGDVKKTNKVLAWMPLPDFPELYQLQRS